MQKGLKSFLITGGSLLLFPCTVMAQEKTADADQSMVKPPAIEVKALENNELTYGTAVKKKEKYEDAHFLTFSFENDLIGGGTDENYTNGVRVTYMKPGSSVPQLIDTIAELVPPFEVTDATSIYYSFGQNLYTPEDIEKRVLAPGDRPYAAWLYGSAGLATARGNKVDEVEIALGVVGPLALGEQTQKFVHKHVNSPKPLGWSNQLKNEPGLVLSWQRSWQNYNNFDLQGFSFRTTPHVGATLGNIYTYANTGVSFSFMPSSQPLQENPLRIRPAIPGNGYYDRPEDDFGWYIFGGLDGRAVARNIFLDGNTFRDSLDVDKKHFVGDANIGVAFTIHGTRLAYTLNYRTKEYDTQDKAQIFGSLSLSQRF